MDRMLDASIHRKTWKTRSSRTLGPLNSTSTGWGEPKTHRRHKTLSAGQDLSFIAVCSEKIERIVNSVGRNIFERDGFHQR